MKINSVSIFRYNTPFKTNRSLNFEGGYKDISDIRERIWFEETLNNYIKIAGKHSLLKKIKFVKVGNIPAKLIINKNYHVLTSYDENIKAVMELEEDNHFHHEINNDFYSKNKGAMKVLLLFSKGKGAGTFLIKEAVKKSYKKGYGGRVILLASSLNKASGCPVPFYYNLGFRAIDADKQKDTKKGMDDYNRTGIYTGPFHIVMYLDEKRIKDYLD